MTNITLSAPKELIEAARQRASDRGTTLNQDFRDWLVEQASFESRERLRRFNESFEKIGAFTSDRKYSREEMNER